ncbi:MAG TPA: DUF397 domain-containing protein [Streptosporangiaceae bacterium]|nr:DUF397 domain-containing protein [Streptosporangiaceae bacterium]
MKSSVSSANGNCVEVAGLPDGEVAVRHSRNADGPVLLFSADEWRVFLTGVRNGEFDGLGVAAPGGRGNRYSFLQWVLDKPWRTLRFALLLIVLIAAAVLAPHLLTLL